MPLDSRISRATEVVVLATTSSGSGRPELRSSIEWAITGDANADAVVTVRYHEPGFPWEQGYPLRRIPAGTAQGFSWTNRFAGSVFDLQPATTYEVELALLDPQ